MHGFYWTKVGAEWVQLAADTSQPFNGYVYTPPPISVAVNLAALAGVSPSYYYGYTIISNLFPQYKEGSAAYWLDVWEHDLYDTNTGVAVSLTTILTDTLASLPTYTGGTAQEITDAVFHPLVVVPPPAFWRDLVDCTETP